MVVRVHVRLKVLENFLAITEHGVSFLQARLRRLEDRRLLFFCVYLQIPVTLLLDRDDALVFDLEGWLPLCALISVSRVERILASAGILRGF